MTEINKTNLLSNLNSTISGFNLSTEDENKLSVFFKAAISTGADPSTIVTELSTRIQSVSSLSTTEQLLLFSTLTNIFTDNRTLSASNLTALNALSSTVSAGSVYHVDSEGIPYVKKSDGSWSKIDPASQNTLLPNAWSWGWNVYGRIGDNSTINKSSPVSVVGGFTDWVQLSGFTHRLGLRANGTAWAWGNNNSGQIGDGTTFGKSSPVSVVGGFTDWIQLDANGNTSFGIRSNGTLWAWGVNTNNQLGDGTSTAKSSPISVSGGITDWTQVSAGGFHTLGLRSNGEALSWGSGTGGRLGNNSTNNASIPSLVVGGIVDWVQLSASGFHSLGLRANGTAWAWGFNTSGQLGDNTSGAANSRLSPVSVVGGFTDWTQLSASDSHSLGLRANGTLWAWGNGSSGTLGDNTVVGKSSPVSVVGGFTDWIQLSEVGTGAIRANGTAWSWGLNFNGSLGDGTTVSTSSPVSVVGGFTDWILLGFSSGIRGSNSIPG